MFIIAGFCETRRDTCIHMGRWNVKRFL